MARCKPYVCAHGVERAPSREGFGGSILGTQGCFCVSCSRMSCVRPAYSMCIQDRYVVYERIWYGVLAIPILEQVRVLESGSASAHYGLYLCITYAVEHARR